jgi:hypothetical protein
MISGRDNGSPCVKQSAWLVSELIGSKAIESSPQQDLEVHSYYQSRRVYLMRRATSIEVKNFPFWQAYSCQNSFYHFPSFSLQSPVAEEVDREAESVAILLSAGNVNCFCRTRLS